MTSKILFLLSATLSIASYSSPGILPIPQGAKFCQISVYDGDFHLSCGGAKSTDATLLDDQEGSASTAMQIQLQAFVAQGFHIISCSHTPASKTAYERWDCFVSSF